ncbi:MAG: RNA polymerase sigma factor [Phascolarctobacterium sp.]|nr:RNA polymerase sigma factor [Phascolarctobacterium sp.]
MFNSVEGSQNNVELAINAGNPSDFKKIYDECMQMLYKVSFRIVNDEEAAEDLAHDSLIKANEKNLVFPSLNDAKYWLIRVVKNASINYVKRKDRERKAYEKVLYEDNRKSENGETDYLKQEAIAKAKEALKKLPKNLQDVLLLREYADLNYKEIGKVLGITEGNVKVRIFRAREQLIKIIGEDNVFLPD